MKVKYNVVKKPYRFAVEISGRKSEITVFAESLMAAKLKLPRFAKNPKLITEEEYRAANR